MADSIHAMPADEAERLASAAAAMLPRDAGGYDALFRVLREWIARHHGLPGTRDEQVERAHLLLHALASADTIGAAAALLARFRRLVWGDRGLRVEPGAGGAALVFEQPVRAGAAGLLGELWSLSLLLAELELLAGGRLDDARGSVRAAADPRFTLTPLLFDRPLSYAAGALALWLPGAALARPVVATGAQVAAFLSQLMPRTLGGAGSAGAGAPPPLAPLVAAMIRADRLRGGDPPLTLAGVAAQLGLGVATVRRRLDAEGRAYRTLRAEVLDELATAWLRAGTAVEAVAARLGYSDGWAFRRAFRRRHGRSPAAWRRGAADPGGQPRK